AYYRNLFHRNQYQPRLTSNPGQTTATSSSSHQLPEIRFLAAVLPTSRAATFTSSVVAVTSVAASSVAAVRSVAASSDIPGGDKADSTNNLPEQITETTSNQPLLVNDVGLENREASDEDELSDSTWLPVEFSEPSTEESTEESSEESSDE
ncbi:24119_t:CDS:1, partial [Dentiscutata erythropus]